MNGQGPSTGGTILPVLKLHSMTLGSSNNSQAGDAPSAVTLTDLWDSGLSYASSYRATGEYMNLELAICHFRILLHLHRTGDPQYGSLLETLAELRLDRYRCLAERPDVDYAIQHARNAVKLAPVPHPERPKRLQILALTLTYRYEIAKEARDIQDAMKYAMEALELTRAGLAGHCASLQTMAWVHRSRHSVMRRLTDLDRAIEYYDDAYRLAAKDSEDYIRSLQGLSASLGSRHQILGRLDDGHRALEYDQMLVQVTPIGHPDRSAYMQNLASSFHDQYQTMKDPDALERAIECSQVALIDMEVQHPHRPECLQNLALYFAHRYERSQDSKDLDHAFTYYNDSFKGITLNPTKLFTAALRWISIPQIREHKDCPKAYSTAFTRLPEIFWIGNSLHSHRAACREIDITGASSDALKACIDQSHLKRAVELVEQGLATSIQQRMQLKTNSHQLLCKADADKLDKLASIIYSQDTSYDERGRAAMERNKLLVAIRKQPGLQHFLQPKPYSQICKASRNGPVVILNSHKDSCGAIVLLSPARDPMHVELEGISSKQLEDKKEVLKRLLGSLQSGTTATTPLLSSPPRRGLKISREETPSEDFPTLLNWLEEYITNPIYTELKKKGFKKGTRLWWCPTGMFQGLPLHATDNSGWFIHSYAVTLEVLSDSHPQYHLDSNWNMGIVGVTKTGPRRKNKLPSVKMEVQNIISHVQPAPQVLLGKKATVAAVEALLRKCSWVHLACHGEQNKSDPLKSCLKLYQGDLDLNTILHLRPHNPEFVFLAACETLKGDDAVINESLHLGGGFLAAGFRGAIGTLWAMSDATGPELAEAVYHCLFRNNKRPKVTEVAEALHLAVIELREMGVSHHKWVPFVHFGV